MTVLFLTGTPSPFQMQLGENIRALGAIDYQIAFAAPTLGDRGRHWSLTANTRWMHLNPGEPPGPWSSALLDRVRPKLVLCGGIRGALYDAAVAYGGRTKTPVGVYAEQPSPRSWPVPEIWRQVFGRRMRRDIAFVLAIGDRAFDTYLSWLRRSADVHQVGYYQDLAPAAHPGRSFSPERTSFLFSGRLLERNQPLVVLRAFAQLVLRHGSKVSLCLSANGPLETEVQGFLRSDPATAARVTFDREFASWEDRLRPFRASDVLVLPATHSGWGLVVPEALRCGLAVVTTRLVEAARQLVSHGRNGLFCQPDAPALVAALEHLVTHPEQRIAMQQAAVSSADCFDAPAGARRLSELLGRYLSC